MSMMIRRAIVGGGGWAPPPPAPPGWTPADITGILDYGIFSDLSRLRQDLAGTMVVTAVGQDVRQWRGQMDVLSLVDVGSVKVRYTAAGIQQQGVGSSYLGADIGGVTAVSDKFVALGAVDDGDATSECAAFLSTAKTQLTNGLFCSSNGRVYLRASPAYTPFGAGNYTNFAVTQTDASLFDAYMMNVTASTGNSSSGAAVGTIDAAGVNWTSTVSTTTFATMKGWAFGTAQLSATDAVWLTEYLDNL